jgi:hypothetical protein
MRSNGFFPNRAAWRVGPALLAGMAVVGCSPTLDWRDWRPAEGGVVLTLPCKPTPQTRTVQLAGQPVRLSLHACSAGGQTWALAYADVGDPTRLTAALVELRDSAARNLGAETLRPGPPLRVSGATPHAESGRWSLSGRMPDGKPVDEELAVFARGTWVFQATVLGAQLPPEGVTTFFESLRVPM